MNYEYFTEQEFYCHCGNEHEQIVEPKLILMLDIARHHANVPFKITSGYRCLQWNKSVGGVLDSAHTKGLAADIAIGDNYKRFQVLDALIRIGFQRIGLYKNFIHCDIDLNRYHPIIWIEE